MNEYQELLISALTDMQGEDLYRMQKYLNQVTPDQMQEPFGAHAQTRAQILAGYEAYHNKIQAAIDWLKAQEPTFSTERAKAVLPHADNLPPQGNTGG